MRTSTANIHAHSPLQFQTIKQLITTSVMTSMDFLSRWDYKKSNTATPISPIILTDLQITQCPLITPSCQPSQSVIRLENKRIQEIPQSLGLDLS